MKYEINVDLFLHHILSKTFGTTHSVSLERSSSKINLTFSELKNILEISKYVPVSKEERYRLYMKKYMKEYRAKARISN